MPLSKRLIASLAQPLKIGNRPDASTQFASLAVSASIPQGVCRDVSTSQINLGRRSSTPGCRLRTKSPTLNARLPHSSHTTQPTQSSVTSGPDSTGNARGLRPFWTTSTQAIAARLWSPTKTACAGLGMSSWSGWHKSISAPSWCTTKVWAHREPHTETPSWLKTYFPLLPFSPQDTTACGLLKTNADASMQSRKVAFNLTPNQTKLFNAWMDATRFVYNSALAAVKRNAVPLKLQELRNVFVKNGTRFLKENPWLSDCPFDVRDEAIRDLVKNHASNQAKQRLHPALRFELHFQTKRSGTGSMSFLLKHWNASRSEYYSGVLKRLGWTDGYSFRCTEPLPKLNHDGRIVKENGRFSLVICNTTHAEVVGSENQRTEHRKRDVVSIDPGVRTFMTCYDPAGFVVEFGADDIQRVGKMQGQIATLQEQQKHVSHHKRYKLGRAIQRLYTKAKNVVRDTHYRVCKWLTHNYDCILLPRLPVSKLVAKEKRRLNGTSVRNLLAWCHSKFYTRLEQYCGLTKSRIVTCTEEYTSITCGKCGELNHALGSSKSFVCPRCKVEIDRDFNAARNILLKYVTDILRPSSSTSAAVAQPTWCRTEGNVVKVKLSRSTSL